MSESKHTPGAGHSQFSCGSCGWVGAVRGRPRCLPCYARRAAEWRANNPTASAEHRRKWRRAKGPEYEAKRKRIRRANNPRTARDAWERRASWLREGDVTVDDLRAVVERDKGRCVYCSERVTVRLTPSDPRGFDHVIPRAAGGRHTGTNLVVCCGACNAVKSSNAIAKAKGGAE